MTPSQASRRKRPVPREIELEAKKDHRESLTLMRPAEEVTLGPGTLFAMVPGTKGKGWILKVFQDPDYEPPAEENSD